MFSNGGNKLIGPRDRLEFPGPLASVIPPGAYVFTIDTENTGTGSSNSDQFQLPTVAATGVPFTVFWGDGSSDVITTWNQAETLHTYSSAGEYTVYIVADFINLAFQDSGDKLKHLTVEQWGNFKFSNGNPNPFFGCSNFTDINASDIPGIPGSTLFRAFRDCSSLNNWGTIADWDVSNVTNGGEIFRGATLFNEVLNWSFSTFTSLSATFRDTAFNRAVNSWDISNVTNLSGTWQNTPFNQPVDQLDTGEVTLMVGTFRDCSDFNQDLEAWGPNLTKVTSMQSFLQDADSFNGTLGTDPGSGGTFWTTIALANVTNMLRGATSFDQSLAWINISLISDASNMLLGGQISTANYDETLIQWSTYATLFGVISGVSVHFGTSTYTLGGAAEAARDNLIDAPELWTIQDGGGV